MKRLSILFLTVALAATPGLLMTSFAQEAPVVFLRCTRDWSGHLKVRQFDGGPIEGTIHDLPRSCADALALLIGFRKEDGPDALLRTDYFEPIGKCIEAFPSGFNGVLYAVNPGCFVAPRN